MPLLTVSQAWAILAIAILLELGGTTSMRLADGLTRLTPCLISASRVGT